MAVEGLASMSGTDQHVLVVEDDSAIRETVAYLLRDAGYTVDEAPDGLPVLARLHASRERLVVLLDLNMPGMDGTEILRAVATYDWLATRHAYIVMTANERALPLNFMALVTRLGVPVIAKPFDIDTLLNTVAQAAKQLAAPK